MASGLVCGFSCVVTFLFYIGCRICDRNSRRCRNSCKCSAGTSIRGAHSNIDFWRGSCSVRTHRFIDFGNLIISFYLPYITYNFSILEIKQFIYHEKLKNIKPYFLVIFRSFSEIKSEKKSSIDDSFCP